MAKGIEVASYDPKKVNVIVGGRTITGFAADGVVSVTKNEDSITPAVGAKGDVTYSENANESGTIAISGADEAHRGGRRRDPCFPADLPHSTVPELLRGPGADLQRD